MAFPRRLPQHFLACALTIGSSSISAANDMAAGDVPTIVVRVDNLASVPADTLQFAEDRAVQVFARIGVTLRWIDQESAIRERFRAPLTLVLVNGEHNQGRASLLLDALGIADATIRRAHVFYDRVAALNVRASRTIPSILGDVMAHELGHLLLPWPGHSSDGIMRPTLEVNLWAAKTFTPSQAQEVLTRIQELR